MPFALNTLRSTLHYRKEAFNAGLESLGFTVVPVLAHPKPEDILILWNRYGGYHEQAARFERFGARVVIAENGYLGKNWRGDDWFALSLWHHAGAGEWPNNGASRWDSWAVPLEPWRFEGKETIIFGQRGIGEPSVRCPDGWAERVQSITGGRIRRHPGTGPAVPLSDDLKNAEQVVTWNSAAAFVALISGIPVWCSWPKWLGASASTPLEQWGLMDPLRSDSARLEMFRRLAWAMWTLEEIKTGEAFRALLAA